MPRTEITIRAATPDDLDMLGQLIAASYATLDDGSYEPERIAAAMPAISKANPALLASGTYFVAEVDGEAAGCGGWTREKPGSGEIAEGVAHIRHFATHPAHLRKGVARALLHHCLREAADAGITTMKSQSTLPAEPFYAAAGFRRIRVIEVETAKGVTLPAVDMERALP
jgi:GNAT superfamily N-acetyltransferase